MKLEFSRQILENNQISNFTKFPPVGAELFHANGRQTNRQTDRQADMTKIVITFHNFANAPKPRNIKNITIKKNQ
jgi:hypothetical protein